MLPSGHAAQADSHRSLIGLTFLPLIAITRAGHPACLETRQYAQDALDATDSINVPPSMLYHAFQSASEVYLDDIRHQESNSIGSGSRMRHFGRFNFFARVNLSRINRQPIPSAENTTSKKPVKFRSQCSPAQYSQRLLCCSATQLN